jgi:hypothetical protein
MKAVGTNTPMKPSAASGAFTTPSESIVLVLAGMNGETSSSVPAGPVTLNTGAYPWPIRYTLTESTDSGWLTWMSYFFAVPPGVDV